MKILPTARQPVQPAFPTTTFPYTYTSPTGQGQGRLRQRHPTLASLISPILLLFRLLAIVPASLGTVQHVYHLINPPPDALNSRVDYGVSILWVCLRSPPSPVSISFSYDLPWFKQCILTAYQCFMLATGLLHRWKIYYPLLPTLIRLLALQAICWPATHLTLSLFDHAKRPLICWAAVGCTTCVSRAIQIWATSNLEGRGRKWDWPQIGRECGLPLVAVHIVMAWSLLIGKEFTRC